MTGVQTCALPILAATRSRSAPPAKLRAPPKLPAAELSVLKPLDMSFLTPQIVWVVLIALVLLVAALVLVRLALRES